MGAFQIKSIVPLEEDSTNKDTTTTQSENSLFDLAIKKRVCL